MALVSEIGDISRFPPARKLCGWAGMTPRVRTSDSKVRHGHITEAGRLPCPGVLTEASYHARRFPPLAATFEAMTKRRGKHIGVAVCRKLLARAFHILRSLEVARVPNEAVPLSEKASDGVRSSLSMA